MNTSEFQQQMRRLKSRYGDKSYDDDFAGLLWRDVQKLQDGVFTRAVDSIVSEHFRAVGKSAILEACNAARSKLKPHAASKIQEIDCNGCDGFGLLAMISSTGRREFASCEFCPNGDLQRALSTTPVPRALRLYRQSYTCEKPRYETIYSAAWRGPADAAE